MDEQNEGFTGAAQLGATWQDGICRFVVWAPNASEVKVRLVAPEGRDAPMTPGENGYFAAVVKNVAPDARYQFVLNGNTPLPDPASRYQPEGVHGPSQVVPARFNWTDNNWFGLPLREYIIYELHVGTFSPEGTFDGVAKALPRLKELGVNAIEIMPVAQFPGRRNWGYDGVGLFAAQNSYGGPEGLKRLVNAAHQHGIAVILDVVYNHLGPEGNYLGQFGPFFTDAYKTPWGKALNFDGPHSDEVRRFFIENALFWQTECHIDALRLDAVHAIRDHSAGPFLRDLARATHARAEELNRRFYLIAESDLNSPRIILPEQVRGYGLDAQWSDDFHHCLRVLLTGEPIGYYQDYTDGLEQFAKVWREGYAYTGQYSKARKARHGDSTELTSLKQFVVCAQNHDQVGNRMHGDRLSALTDFESLKLAAGAVLLSPFLPMLFMGEEYAERAPFQYFVDHSDKQLLEAVRQGRREEFASFAWKGEVPDPGSEETFARSRLSPPENLPPENRKLLAFYRRLIELRRSYRCITLAERKDMSVQAFDHLLVVRYPPIQAPEVLVLLNFGSDSIRSKRVPAPGNWRRVLDSADVQWGGPGVITPDEFDGEPLRLSPRSVVVYRR